MFMCRKTENSICTQNNSNHSLNHTVCFRNNLPVLFCDEYHLLVHPWFHPMLFKRRSSSCLSCCCVFLFYLYCNTTVYWKFSCERKVNEKLKPLLKNYCAKCDFFSGSSGSAFFQWFVTAVLLACLLNAWAMILLDQLCSDICSWPM